MKHRSNKVNFLSYSSRRKRRRGNRREIRKGSLSNFGGSLTGLSQESDTTTCTMEIDISLMSFDDDREDHVQELFHPSLSANSMIPFMDVSSWLGTAGEMGLTKLPSTLFHVCNWWKTKVSESLEFAKDVVFPSRVYRRELYATQEQISLLQKQLQRVRKEMEIKMLPENPGTTACPHCCCPLHNSSTSRTHIAPSGEPEALALAPPAPSAQPIPTAPTLPPLPPPPPPPAPPPPPPQSFAPPVDWRQNLRDKREKKKGSTSNKKESNKNPVISLTDIKSVKLKKVDRTNKKCESSAGSSGGPLVTLSDLQAVQLKKSSKHSTQSAQFISPMNLRKRLSLEAADFRTSLKRVGLPRSPGGTPFRTKPAESGVGLTPIMTRALRRKFRSVTISPSSPRSGQNSPFTPPGIRI